MALIDPLATEVGVLHDVAGSRLVESSALAGLPPMTLMRRAGRAVARLVLALPGEIAPGPVLVVAGSGHNGGDGWAAALELKRARRTVMVWEPMGCSATESKHLRHEALEAHVKLTGLAPQQEVVDDPVVLDWTPSLEPAKPDTLPQDVAVPAMQELRFPPSDLRPALVIDALLGLGAGGTLRQHAAAAIDWMREQAAAGVPVLSIDLPSGLCAPTGAALMDADGKAHAVKARHTLSLLTLKPGLFTGQGREYSGRLWFDDLECSGQLHHTPPLAHLATGKSFEGPLRASRRDAFGHWRHEGHKGTHGDVWIIGGAPGMVGAAVLAARAASRAGAGRVHLHRLDAGTSHEEHRDHSPREGMNADAGAPEILGVPAELTEVAPRGSLSTVVAGCGGGVPIATLLPALLHGATRLVLDADALNALAHDLSLQQRLRSRHSRGLPTILTPHPLEAARLLGCSTAEVQADRLKAARELAERLACTVVLKGSGTVTASPGLVPWINGTGNARLATAGSGDVLAGWIGGAWSSWAQESHAPHTQAHQVAAAVVALHGLAASSERLSDHPGALTASDLIDRMGQLL